MHARRRAAYRSRRLGHCLIMKSSLEIFAVLARDAKDDLLVRFRRRTTIKNGCWIWNGYIRNGYGTVSFHGSPTYIHHLSYAIHHGPIPCDEFVLHKCDTGRCWNPQHLFSGTHELNMADMRAKGRARNSPMFGMDNPKSTLTDSQVRDICARFEAVPQRALADFYGVTQSTIYRIGHGHTRNRGISASS